MNEGVHHSENDDTTRYFTLTQEQVRLLKPDSTPADPSEHTESIEASSQPKTIVIMGKLILRRAFGAAGETSRMVSFYDLPEVDGVAILGPQPGHQVHDAVKESGGGSALLAPTDNEDALVIVPKSLLRKADDAFSNPNMG